MAEEKEEGCEEGKGKAVKFKGFGVELDTKGYHFGNFLQMLTVGLLGIMSFMIYEQRADVKEAAAAAAATASVEHKTLHSAIDKQTEAVSRTAEAQNETTYILTLNQAQRERLNVQMPNTLRRKVIGRDQ